MDTPVWDFRFPQLCYSSAMWHCAVGQGVADIAMDHCVFIFWLKQHPWTGSSSILEQLAHSDEGTIILKMSVMPSINTASQSKTLESSWADLLMIMDLDYHNHPWSSHSSARRRTVWVQKPQIFRHSEVVHGMWISLEGLDLLSTSERRKTRTCTHAPRLSILKWIFEIRNNGMYPEQSYSCSPSLDGLIIGKEHA